VWSIAQSSITLFFQGKLFADPRMVFIQLAIGILVTVVVMVAAAKLGAPLPLAALIAGLVGGVLQPFLFRRLKYQ